MPIFYFPPNILLPPSTPHPLLLGVLAWLPSLLMLQPVRYAPVCGEVETSLRTFPPMLAPPSPCLTPSLTFSFLRARHAFACSRHLLFQAGEQADVAEAHAGPGGGAGVHDPGHDGGAVHGGATGGGWDESGRRAFILLYCLVLTSDQRWTSCRRAGAT